MGVRRVQTSLLKYCTKTHVIYFFQKVLTSIFNYLKQKNQKSCLLQTFHSRSNSSTTCANKQSCLTLLSTLKVMNLSIIFLTWTLSVICRFVRFVQVLRGRVIVSKQQPKEDKLILLRFNGLMTEETASEPHSCCVSLYLIYVPFPTCYLLSLCLSSLLPFLPLHFPPLCCFLHSVSCELIERKY